MMLLVQGHQVRHQWNKPLWYALQSGKKRICGWANTLA